VDKWRREPWEANPYEFIPGFMVARDLPQPDAAVVLDKLSTSLEEGWTDDYLAGPGRYWPHRHRIRILPPGSPRHLHSCTTASCHHSCVYMHQLKLRLCP